MNEDIRDSLIVALDGTVEETRAWAQALEGTAGWVKVGMTLYYAEGPAIISEFKAKGFKVFLDLKMHDIPHQVKGAAEVLGGLGVGMLTVQASGGFDMIKAAVEGSKAGAIAAGCTPPIVLAVTVLTSMDSQTLRAIGIEDSTQNQVVRLAKLAVSAGATGIVCSPLEAQIVRDAVGPSIAIVTPGVRPSWAANGDQERIATPAHAMAHGSTHLVVGRPITGSDNPAEAAMKVLMEMESGIV